MVKEIHQTLTKRNPPSNLARNGTNFDKVCRQSFLETSQRTLSNNDEIRPPQENARYIRTLCNKSLCSSHDRT